jgi:hypothetical protein
MLGGPDPGQAGPDDNHVEVLDFLRHDRLSRCSYVIGDNTDETLV